jgi:hypothetical protein
VIRLLFLDDPVSASVVAKFVSVKAMGGPEHVDALRWLRDLRVWENSASTGGSGGGANGSRADHTVSLNHAFRAGLRPVIAGGGAAWIGSEGKKGGRAERADPAELERWGVDQWEKVLHYMVQDEGQCSLMSATVPITSAWSNIAHPPRVM